MNILSIISFGLILLGAQNASAENAFESLFREGTLQGFAVGDEISYRQIVTDEKQKLDAQESDLTLEAVSEDDLKMVLDRDEGERLIGTYPKSVGNPVHMYFLEKLIGDMSSDTGGSAFYIRNRIKESLSATSDETAPCADETLEGQCLTLKPFEHDDARDRMGSFADLQITFRVSEDNPAWILGIEAKNPDAPEVYDFDLELE